MTHARPEDRSRLIERGSDAGCRWHAQPGRSTLERVTAGSILAAADDAIRSRGEFHLVLAGGDTPRAVYALLRGTDTDWSAWHVYFGDERCLPTDDPGRNSRMADETWLAHVSVPESQRHPIPAELGATRAALAYQELLRPVGTFDLVLLGLGDDGHTASLFPGRDWGTAANSPDALAVFDAPKPPPERVSLSAARLSRARQAIFLVAGESKRDAVAAWRAGRPIPASAITPASGVDVLVESRLFAAPSP